VRAAAAIVATNAWLGDLLPRLRDLVRPVQGQLVATAPMPPSFPFGMAAQITEGGEYWQQAPDGTIVLGGCRTVVAAPPEPGRQRPQPEVHEALVGVLPQLFPAIGPINAVRGWAGAMAFTPDHLPIVDQLDDSIWAIGGFCGHGMPFGASIASLVADSIVAGVRAPALAPFALDRPTLVPAGSYDT
jgi:glycine/D-amino acid oxidase-like deaminating enzyme